MSLDPLIAISPLDGRYASKMEPLRGVFSEYGLMARRVRVEIEWLIVLGSESAIAEVPAFDDAAKAQLRAIGAGFGLPKAARVKAIEATTNHDVKAIEYFIKERMAEFPALAPYREFVHFACTSEDINNLAYALMLKDARDGVFAPTLKRLRDKLAQLAKQAAAKPMLSRTHGQTASPTTLGKEIAITALLPEEDNLQGMLKDVTSYFERVRYYPLEKLDTSPRFIQGSAYQLWSEARVYRRNSRTIQ